MLNIYIPFTKLSGNITVTLWYFLLYMPGMYIPQKLYSHISVISKYTHGKFEFSLDKFFTFLCEVGSD